MLNEYVVCYKNEDGTADDIVSMGNLQQPLTIIGNRIYFCSCTSIFSVDLDGKDKKECTIDNQYLSHIAYHDNNWLYCAIDSAGGYVKAKTDLSSWEADSSVPVELKKLNYSTFLGDMQSKVQAANNLIGIKGFHVLFNSDTSVSRQTQDLLSFSPDGKNELILKRDVSTGKTVDYHNPFLFFARPNNQFPYTVYGEIKTQWLTGDICAVTYVSEKDGPAHQYVATFGSRGRDDYYYVEAALDGSWVSAENNTVGWKLVRNSNGLVLTTGSGEERYGPKDCVQYGLTTIALCRNGLPQWTVALNEDCKIDQQSMLVSSGGTLTVCKVSMDPTAPLVLRSTRYSGDSSKPLAETAEKDTYRVQNGVLSFTWDYGHRWTNVPIPQDGLKSILSSDKTTLTSGCWHIADDESYLVYGRMPLTVLYTPDQGKTWQSHKVTDIGDDGIDSYSLCFTSPQTGYVATGLHGTPSARGALLFSTKDGGQTWQTCDTPSLWTFTGMNFLNQDIGFLSYSTEGGGSGELYETTDGGQSFTKVILPDGNIAEANGPFGQVYDTPQVPHLENGVPVLYVTQGSNGDFGNYRARYESKDGGKTWQYVSQEKP